MKINFGKALVGRNTLGKDINIDLHTYLNNDNCNILTVGAPGVGKTTTVKNRLKQLVDDVNTKIIIVTDHVKEYAKLSKSENATLISMDELQNNYTSTSDIIRKQINVNYISDIETWLIYDYHGELEDRIVDFISTTLAFARVHNCIVNIVVRSINELHSTCLSNISVFEIFKPSADDLHFDGLSKIMQGKQLDSMKVKVKYLDRFKKIFIFKGNKILLNN
ncbi:MAG: hypothetical protein J6A59_09070 [Lachnospiraceae bacterium]|nr:hypothetical protein [Lachnospiraceae bacterium]